MRPLGLARTTTSQHISIVTAGPFDQWPSRMGFEYFYGFIGGETDQAGLANLRKYRGVIAIKVGCPSHDRSGGRGDQVYEQSECVCGGQAVRPLLRPRRHPFAAPTDERVD